jgi:hypothetical protein
LSSKIAADDPRDGVFGLTGHGPVTDSLESLQVSDWPGWNRTDSSRFAGRIVQFGRTTNAMFRERDFDRAAITRESC